MSAFHHVIPRAGRTSQAGLGLIELMVAMLLGLLVAGSAVAIFSTNRQSYAATESLGRIQENARLAYELMARDLRAAGGTPCSRTIPVANVTTGSQWWQSWGNGSVVGYEQGASAPSGAPSNMTTTGDALVALTAEDTPLSVVIHNNVAGTFKLNAKPTSFNAMDLAVVCDFRQASLFQIKAGGVDTTNNIISYSKSGMNCTRDLSMPVKCSSTKSGVQYGNNAMVSRLRSVAWYIRDNGKGVSSLYQSQLGTNGTVVDQEIVEGVTSMQVTYLLSGGTGYVNAASVGGGTNWANVVAVRVALTLQGGEGQGRVSTTNGALTRTLVQTISLRNHQS